MISKKRKEQDSQHWRIWAAYFVLEEKCCTQNYLPTLRDILQHGLLLREQNGDDIRNYPAADVAKDIYPKILEK